MTATVLSAVAGVILSLLFSYWPGLRDRFKSLGDQEDGANDGTQKRLVMLGLLLVTTLFALGLSCTSFGVDLLARLNLTLTCDRVGIIDSIVAYGAAAIANQSAYQISPRIAKGYLPARARKGRRG